MMAAISVYTGYLNMPCNQHHDTKNNNITMTMKNRINMILKDSILKNSIYLIATNFSNLAIGFFFWMIVARYYTPDDVGKVSAILSSMFLISMISTVGLPMALTFYLPRYSDKGQITKIISSCITLSIITSIIFSVVFILGINIWAPKLDSLLDPKLAIIFILSTIFTTISALMIGMFTAGKRSSFHMIKENIFGLARISLIILMVNLGAIGIFVSWSIGLMIAVITGFVFLSKLWKYTPSIKLDPIVKDMTHFSIANYIAGIFYNLPKFIFPVMIIHMLSEAEAGYYFIAMAVASLLFGISEAIAGPFIAESKDTEKFWNNVNKVIKFNVLLLIPGILLFLILGKFVLNLFNPNYAIHSFNAMIILAVTSIPLSLVVIFNMIKNSQKKVITVIKVDAVVTVITLILSIFLIRIGIEGIALSYLIANTVMAIIIIFKMKNPIEFIYNLAKLSPLIPTG